MRARHIRLVAGRDLLDVRRQRGVWVALLILPFVNVSFLLLLPGFLNQRQQASLTKATYRVAVESGAAGTADGIFALQPVLDAGRFSLTSVENARQAVLSGPFDVGIRLEPGATNALARDGQVRGELLLLTTRNRSRAGFEALAAALEDVGARVATERLAARGLPPRVARPLTVETVDVTQSGRGPRLALSTVLPLVVLLPLTGAVGIAAQRISGSKDQRVFEPLLVLPFTRGELLAGKALSALALGTITLPAVAVPLVVGRVLPIGQTGQSIALPAAESAGVLALAVLLLALLVALGIMIGAASRTSAELGSVLQLATLPIFLLGLFLQFRSGIESRPSLLVLPFFGPLLAVRDLAIGALTVGHAVLVVVATALWAGALLTLAARLIESERSVLRPTS